MTSGGIYRPITLAESRRLREVCRHAIRELDTLSHIHAARDLASHMGGLGANDDVLTDAQIFLLLTVAGDVIDLVGNRHPLARTLATTFLEVPSARVGDGRSFNPAGAWASVVTTRERALLRFSEGDIPAARRLYDAAESLRVRLVEARIPMPAGYTLPEAPTFDGPATAATP